MSELRSARFPASDVVAYLRDPLGYLLRAREQYGPFARLPLGVVQPLFINDPALIEHVLVTDNRSYSKDYFMRMLSREVVGQGLLSSEGDFWRRQRRLAQPAFHRDRIAEYAAVMVRCAQGYVDSLSPGQQRNVHADMMGLTLQIVEKTLFGSDAHARSVHVGDALDLVMRRYSNNLLLAFPAVGRLPLPMNWRFARAMARLDDTILQLIARRRAAPTAQGDLLSLLLSAQDEDGSGMTDRQLRDEVITLFIAGHETTALVLSYALWLLSQAPHVAAALHDELHRVLGDRAASMADVPSLRLCEAVLFETMRLYPPAWVIGREALHDTTLGGVPVRRGAQVWISTWVMHRDPTHFSDPDRFRPDRWLDGLARRLPRFAYFPFGGGPRLCIGSSFAMTEAVLILATIARRFQLRLQLPGGHMPLLPSITLRPAVPLPAFVELVPSACS